MTYRYPSGWTSVTSRHYQGRAKLFHQAACNLLDRFRWSEDQDHFRAGVVYLRLCGHFPRP